MQTLITKQGEDKQVAQVCLILSITGYLAQIMSLNVQTKMTEK